MPRAPSDRFSVKDGLVVEPWLDAQGVDLIMKCAVALSTRTDAYKPPELLNLQIEIKETSDESRD